MCSPLQLYYKYVILNITFTNKKGVKQCKAAEQKLGKKLVKQ